MMLDVLVLLFHRSYSFPGMPSVFGNVLDPCPGRKAEESKVIVKESHVWRLPTVGAFAFPLLAWESAKGRREIGGGGRLYVVIEG